MFRLFLLINLLLVLSVSPAFGSEVIIPAGTELSVVSSSIINTSSMNVGDEANFTLASDVAGVSVLIPKGTELLGRVVEVEKFDGDKGESRVVLMFDFVKVGEEFYAITAVVISTTTDLKGLKIENSKEFDGCTKMSMKGGEMNIAAGTTFKLKVLTDVTNE